MLFEKAKHVFNRKAPKIHLRKFDERNGERASPKKQQGTFETRRVISLEKFDREKQADEEW